MRDDLDQILAREGWLPISTADRTQKLRLNYRTPQGTPIGTVGWWTGVSWREDASGETIWPTHWAPLAGVASTRVVVVQRIDIGYTEDVQGNRTPFVDDRRLAPPEA